jgi:hypothetical protein
MCEISRVVGVVREMLLRTPHAGKDRPLMLDASALNARMSCVETCLDLSRSDNDGAESRCLQESARRAGSCIMHLPPRLWIV